MPRPPPTCSAIIMRPRSCTVLRMTKISLFLSIIPNYILAIVTILVSWILCHHETHLLTKKDIWGLFCTSRLSEMCQSRLPYIVLLFSPHTILLIPLYLDRVTKAWKNRGRVIEWCVHDWCCEKTFCIHAQMPYNKRPFLVSCYLGALGFLMILWACSFTSLAARNLFTDAPIKFEIGCRLDPMFEEFFSFALLSQGKSRIVSRSMV